MSDARVVHRIEDIAPQAWDALVSDTGFYESHGWLRGQQRPEFAAPAYLCLERDGALVAAVPTYEFPPENAPPLPAVAAGRKVLRVGTRTGYHNEFLVDESAGTAEDRRQLVAELLEFTAEYAAGRGYDTLLFDCLTTDSLRTVTGLFPARAQLRTAEAVVHNEGGTFASYRKMLGRNVLNRDKEMRRFEKAGLRLETGPLSQSVDELAPLIGQTMDRYGAGLDLGEIRTFLSEQARALDADSVVFRCVDESGRLLGGNVSFVWRDSLYFRVAGFDYDRTGKANEYFNAVFYGPVKYMEQEGLKTLHVGLASLEAKVRRGASLHPIWSCAVDLPLTRGVKVDRDLRADLALMDSVREEAGAGMDAGEWDMEAALRPS
ncbi:GNAT family N-acetyltransferase (plasmid) [Streptomyces sp. NBC_01591]|uniref:hypothetical protein n=1 Tax=Streptomyces sp. NBC_01591 TaxID=2975888 RepID=UPI002DD8F51B|nr:hypothetical protein [Streptomyces sp. NBC_01591]WSD74039.1 GNAT family N-acetyltransferase [Streptomyces sp. NBC_01591]